MLHRASDGYKGGNYAAYVADPNIDYGAPRSCSVQYMHDHCKQSTPALCAAWGA